MTDLLNQRVTTLEEQVGSLMRMVDAIRIREALQCASARLVPAGGGSWCIKVADEALVFYRSYEEAIASIDVLNLRSDKAPVPVD